MTIRDADLLRLIHKKRYLRRGQILTLLPEFPSIQVLNRRLRFLYEKHFIDKYIPQLPQGMGTSQQYVCLDRAGVIYLELEKYNKPIRYTPDGQRYLPADWRHHMQIIDTECYLRKNYNVRFVYQEKSRRFGPLKQKLIPDLFAFIRSEKQGDVFFIEVDMGTEDIGKVKYKIDRYNEYYWSRDWRKEDWTKRFVEPPFPCLIVTTVDKHQRINALREYCGKLNFMSYVVAQDDFPATLNEHMRA